MNPPDGYRLATEAELDCLPAGAVMIDPADPDDSWDTSSYCEECVPEDCRVLVYAVPITSPSADPKGAAGASKPQLQLLPPVFNRETAKALALGGAKYGPWNWRKNHVELMTYLGAMKRHIDAVLDGEDVDPESGAHHLGHVAAGCAIVLDAGSYGHLIDNRPRKL